MLDDDPLWYKDAIIYELHVRAFHDTAGDGMGDLRGLTQKLDYLQDLGVTAVWLLPFYPSPLKDDGYDIADYNDVHPHYGTLRDFQEFLDAAHAHGLRVITELVINHTSDQHPWFQRARRSPPGSPERDFYVWSDSPEKYKEARIIFKDFESSNWSWDPVAKAYYWHRFYSHQPDLNYDNPAVWDAILPVVDRWLEMGVDGVRLDAIPYLYERDGTGCENLPETHTFLKALRAHVDARFQGRMFLAEANQWPEDAVAYFGQGDECHMAFHFPVMPRLFMAIHMEDRFPIIDIMQQTPPIPDNCQWCMFLRNHDELTLEMVTDEERDYMYRAYANDPRARINLGIRRRLAPLLGNNRRRIELMNGLLFSLPGTPVIYYGDEIGMGDNIYLGDRNGVRTPMQWNGDRNAGFSRANPQKLYLPVIIDPEYHYEAVNVEAQQNNPNSLLWWMKRLIALRKRYKAFGRGTLEFLHPSNRRILAFLRRYQEERILVVANLSRFVQYVELDLSEFQGLTPVELFGRNPFPPVGKGPYLMTVGPHAIYGFALEPARPRQPGASLARAELPQIHVKGSWEELFRGSARGRLEEVLPAFLQEQPWAGGNTHTVRSAIVREAFRLRYGDALTVIALVEADFGEPPLQTFLLPLTVVPAERAAPILEAQPEAAVARLRGDADGILIDALTDTGFTTTLLDGIAQNKTLKVGAAELVARAYRNVEEAVGPDDPPLTPVLNRAQSNTSLTIGGRLFLKVFRRVEEGVNPDLEVVRYLNERGQFTHVPTLLGAIEYRSRRSEPVTLAVLQTFVPNEGHAWQYTLDELSRYYERVLALPDRPQSVPLGGQAPGVTACDGRTPEKCPSTAEGMLALAAALPPPEVEEIIGSYLSSAVLLGGRTAEMHLALAGEKERQEFTPEPYTTLYQRGLYQSLRNLKRRAFDLLRLNADTLPEEERAASERVLGSSDRILDILRQIVARKVGGLRIRYHGDYHLGHILHTGKDFVVIDFEGNPERSINDRRQKRSPLRDVVSMMRSFRYAAYSALFGHGSGRGRSPGDIRPEDLPALRPWARYWHAWVSAAFLRAYLTGMVGSGILPESADDLRLLMDVFKTEKALQEVVFELRHRPEMVRIPLLSLVERLDSDGGA